MTDVNSSPNTETRNVKSERLHQFTTLEIIELMNEEDQSVPVIVKGALPQIERVIDCAVAVMKNGGKLFYFGAGTSGRLGVLDASECPPTFGVAADLVNGIIAGGDRALRYPIEGAEDSKETGIEDVRKNVTSNDMVIGIASSGRTPYVLGAIEAANQLGVPTAGIACNNGSELSTLVTYPVELPVGAEVVTGSTRLKAGTAQKMVLNMITTASMIKLGKVYQNLMVNVQASNEKLRKRTVSIIQELTGVSEREALRSSKEAEGDPRVAVIMILLKVGVDEAQEMLEKKDGNFAEVMKGLEKE
ncbi:N-acetylmuramic acid 6-phosphate etherase [Pseudalkalibacillus hwajinpoensis]|uniref:N-acetylmuramic acid 6-phosphate etherase n=1 Tax=Guptibacillus hwajinpoensis TaxID=208199 RepID=A0A4U1MK26_9BACL|nr:N-acetylmuramic acid 6-phosphate etherase [Pseudalkalibacillus hwajinpoensis]TKD70886.1 N-acetylmuramic acid 6-phosphate etherase [Pseudalkalibacillus hwajinpoensis]